jgi:hypothetical protein
MSKLNLALDTSDTALFISSLKNVTANNLEQLFKSLSGGARLKTTTLSANMTPVAATGTLAVDDATVNGTVGGVINGVTITVASASDTGYVVAQAIATAINASSNALVQNLVTAAASNPTGDDGLVTITANIKYGLAGNCMTLSASGTGITASGTRLGAGGASVAGSNGTVTAFTY